MERIKEEQFFKDVEEDGEVQPVLDYTMRYTYSVETIPVEVEGEVEEREIETLIKTERLDEYGTWLVEAQPGCISVRNIEPTQKYIDEHPEEFAPRPETPEEKMVRLEVENADLWYQTMLDGGRIEASEQSAADLWYELMLMSGGGEPDVVV